MYKLSEIKDIHLEITRKCNARCPMCPRTKRLNAGEGHLLRDEITVDLFKEWFSVEFVSNLRSLRACGNLGDAIMAKDTLKIFQYLRVNNDKMTLRLHTNGSARGSSWWKELAKLKVCVTFAIDGLEDTSKLYRVNTDWNKIIKNAKIFIQAGGLARWTMLIFKHNEHQVEECRRLAESIGFEEFVPKHTVRFNGKSSLDVYDSSGELSHTLEPTAYSDILHIKEKKASLSDCSIECKALQSKSIYVAANGVVSPCCWVGNGINTGHSLYTLSLKDIFNTNTFDKIKDSWSSTPLKVCSTFCGNFKKCESQFIEKNI